MKLPEDLYGITREDTFTSFEFTFYGKAVGLNRKALIVNNKYYNSPEYREYVADVGKAAQDHMVMSGKCIEPTTKCLAAEIETYNYRNDIDALKKGLFDGLEGIIYFDDCQIHRECTTKRFDPSTKKKSIHVKFTVFKDEAVNV